MSKAKTPKTRKQHIQDAIKTLIIIAVIAGAIWAWEDYFEDRVIPKKFGVVTQDKIYRSGQISYALIDKVLENNDIKVIVDLTLQKVEDRDQDAERAAVEKLGIEVYRYPMGGNGIGTIEYYTAAVAAIDKAVKEGKPVLVHCQAGAQRTGGVIATYRMLIQKRDADSIIKEMQKYGWRDHKNPDLLPFLNESIPLIAENLKQMGIIQEINIVPLAVD